MNIKAKILTSCRELCYEKGISGFTVDELAQRAQISKRTLYRYFRSKDEIIKAMFADFMREVAINVEQIAVEENNPIQAIKQIFEFLATRGKFFTHTRALEDLRDKYPFIWEEINAFRIQKMVIIMQKIREKKGGYITDKNTDLIIINLIIAAVQNIMNPEFLLDNNIDFREAAYILSNIIIKLF